MLSAHVECAKCETPITPILSVNERRNELTKDANGLGDITEFSFIRKGDDRKNIENLYLTRRMAW